MKNQSLYCENSYIDLGQQYLINNKDVSFSIWINPQKKDDTLCILSQNYSRSGGGRFACGIVNNKAYIYVGSEGIFSSEKELLINNWYNITITYHNGSMVLYLNGNKEITLQVNDFHEANTFLLSYLQGSSEYFYGLVDEFKIYSYALNENEVRQQINRIAENYEKMSLYFNFDNIYNNNEVENLVTKQKYKIYNFFKLSADTPPLQYYKYLIKQYNDYYSLQSSFHKLGQPKDNMELEKWYKEEGVNDLNVLCINKELLPQIKKIIGNKFQIAKWKEK